MTGSSSALTSASHGFFRPFWTWKHCPPWLIALAAMLILGCVRCFAMLGPSAAQPLYLLYCVAACGLPFVLLSSAGLKEIGLALTETRLASLAWCVLAGAGCALFLFCAGTILFGNSAENWDVSIRGYLRIQDLRGLMPSAAIFALYLVPAMTLTPLGEEMLFRGLVHQTFARRWNAPVGAVVNSLGYGLVYSYVHAIWRNPQGLHLRMVSGCTGALLMTGAGIVFTLCRVRTGRLSGAVVAHATFNVAIVALVVYFSPQ